MVANKVVFLDFDGVLNNEIMYHPGYDNKFKDEPYPISAFDSNCIDKVNRLFQETGAKMVISSSWRIDELERIQNICSRLGLPTEFDRTPILLDKRGKEIKQYLNKHPEIDNYVIFDDDSDMLPEQMEHFIKCKEYTGITDEDIEKAIEILNKDKWN